MWYLVFITWRLHLKFFLEETQKQFASPKNLKAHAGSDMEGQRMTSTNSEEHLEVLQWVEKSWEGQQLKKKKTFFWMKVSFYCANHNLS